jgi:hypothetical protein
VLGALALTFAQVVGTVAVPNTGKLTAAVVVKQSLALGIDFAAREPGQSRASRSDLRALFQASPGSWLDGQIEVADDSIGEPPEELRRFLLMRREAIWAIIAALEKSPPVWKVQPSAEAIPRLMPWIRLHKVLLATALIEEREGRNEEADRALEASWSLGRGFPGPNVLIARILGVAVESWQAGVVRKFRAAPRSWIDRLADDEPWRRLGGAIASEGRIRASEVPAPAGKERPDVAIRAMAAVARALPSIAPCDRNALSDDALWLHAAAVFRVDSSAEARNLEALCKDVIQGNVATIIRRTARLRVDRELSSKILELRRERAGSANGKWPENVDIASTICPGAAYRYSLSGERMEIRFEGSVDDPEAGVVLPLEYAAQ